MAVSVASKASFGGRTFKFCVLTRWDFDFCVRTSPLRGRRESESWILKIAKNECWCTRGTHIKDSKGDNWVYSILVRTSGDTTNSSMVIGNTWLLFHSFDSSYCLHDVITCVFFFFFLLHRDRRLSLSLWVPGCVCSWCARARVYVCVWMRVCASVCAHVHSSIIIALHSINNVDTTFFIVISSSIRILFSQARERAHMHAYVCVWVCACACVRACVRARECACVCMCVKNNWFKK